MFIAYVKDQSRHYRTNNVIITMGGDFTYQDAGMWYTNLDKLIQYTNLKAAKDGLNIKLFYSTPNCYLKAVKDADPVLPVKQDDFFPYASDPNSYWTGYFSSRPTTKLFEREGNNYLQVAKQLQVLAGLEEHNMFMLNPLKSAMGVMQHHDAITGTEKQHVTFDYVRMLNEAIDDSLIIPHQAFNKVMQNGAEKPPLFTYHRCPLNESSCPVSENSNKLVVTLYNPVAWSVKEPVQIPVTEGNYEVFAPNGDKIQSQVEKIPDYVLRIATRESIATHLVAFIAYLEPLMYKSFYIRKVNKTKRDIRNTNVQSNEMDHTIKDYVRKIENTDIETDLENKFKEPMKLQDLETVDTEDFEDKDLERIIKEARGKIGDGARKREAVAYPNMSDAEMRMMSDEPAVVEKLEDYFVMKNKNIEIHIDNTSGEVLRVTFPETGPQQLGWAMFYYPGCVGNNEIPANRSSGAYIFRPNATQPIPLYQLDYNFTQGPVYSELSVAWSHKVFSTMRLYDDADHIDIGWFTGDIDISDNIGKEFMIRFRTDVVSNGEFFTDSNGRQMLKRKLNKRPQWNVTLSEPVAGNYYPVTNEIYLENEAGERVTVLTDRAEGGSSLIEGNVDLMIHRRLLHDDAFGVGEALNETANGKGLEVIGQYRLFFSKVDHKAVKKNQLSLHLKPLVFVADAGEVTLEEWLKLKNCYSWLKQALPEGIHLLTLEPWGDKILLRLENFLTPSDTSTVEVDLTGILKNLNIKSVKETMLSAYEDKSRGRWLWKTEDDFSANFNKAYGSFDEVQKAVEIEDRVDDGLKVKIAAKEIRTFIISYDYVE